MLHHSISTKKRGHTHLQWIFALLANCTLLLYGMESGWISPIASLLQSSDSPAGYPLSDTDISWTASVLSISAMVGVLPFSFIADRYGRKTGLIVIAILEAISWIIRLVNSSFPLLIVARLFAGLAAGGCYNIAPMYVKEICQENLTGILGTFPVLMNTSGIFFMYVMGAYLNYNTVIIIVTLLPIITILLMLIAPESPAFLVKQDKIEKAKETIALLRGLYKEDTVVLDLVESMIKEQTRFKALPNITLLNILKNSSWRRGFILITLVFTFYEINGAYVIITYASIIVASTGVHFPISPEIQSLIFPIVMIIASFTLLSCVEKFGRKPLLLFSYIITAFAMFTLAGMIEMQRMYGNVPAWLPIIALILIVAMCSGGVSPLSFIIMTDMFNFQIRAKVMGVVVTYGWLLTFVAQSTYTSMANTMGDYAPFIFYGCVNLAGVLFTIFLLPETKGKSEEEIYQTKSRKTEDTSI